MPPSSYGGDGSDDDGAAAARLQVAVHNSRLIRQYCHVGGSEARALLLLVKARSDVGCMLSCCHVALKGGFVARHHAPALEVSQGARAPLRWTTGGAALSRLDCLLIIAA